MRSSSSIRSTGATPSCGLERLQQRPAYQEALGEYVVRERLAIHRALRLGQPDLDHLPRVVPLVHRGGGVQAFVALQAHQRAPERDGEHLGDFGLADAGLALEEQGTAKLQRQKDAGGEPSIAEIVVLREQREHAVDGIRERGGGHGQRELYTAAPRRLRRLLRDAGLLHVGKAARIARRELKDQELRQRLAHRGLLG